MRVPLYCSVLMTATLLAGWPRFAGAQPRERMTEEEFVAAFPAVGDQLPEVTLYDGKGDRISTSSLRGHYTVLTFGCLT